MFSWALARLLTSLSICFSPVGSSQCVFLGFGQIFDHCLSICFSPEGGSQCVFLGFGQIVDHSLSLCLSPEGGSLFFFFLWLWPDC